jgi:hypothetical protein
MNERRINPFIALLSVIALSMPLPAAAQARSILVSNCMGGMDRFDIPADPAAPSDHGCCNKGCHAANDRRKKNQGNQEDCC